ncbi:unnamed protein product [Brassica napus]|uniref:(rape) hypothetical protein n=1 Tax=Brassica napus TaxID=3708 RepID=A0A816I2E4_BRANA|nr:unnamed protein product [Brassica napus]
MANSQIHFSNLKAKRCKEAVLPQTSIVHCSIPNIKWK